MYPILDPARFANAPDVARFPEHFAIDLAHALHLAAFTASRIDDLRAGLIRGIMADGTQSRFVDFQVPPTDRGWYGVICDAGNDVSAVAAYWTGRDWLDYPMLPWMRSRVAFDTEEEAEAWLEQQRPRT